jgi:DNA-binding NarL/FixJ family response regulator
MLIVDDDDLFAQTVDLIAEMTPRVAVVGRAQDGGEALVLANELAPDLIVLDIELPVLDGLVVARRLRGRGFAGPIVCVSGSDYDDVESKAIAAGATSFVRKSRAHETLISAIRSALDRIRDSRDVVYAA